MTASAASPQAAPQGTFAAFSDPGFRALWTSTLLSTLGIVASVTTQFLVIADLTGSNSGVGVVIFALGLPMLFLAPVAGVLADRLSKRRLLFGCQTVMAAATLGLGMLVATDMVSVPWVVVMSLLSGGCIALLGCTQVSFMGRVVAPEKLGNATALFQTALALSRTLGPFVVAALVAWDAAGFTGSYFAVAALFAAASLPLVSLPPARGSGAATESILHELTIGARHVASRPRLRRLVVAFCAVTLVGFSYFVVLPRLVTDVLGAGDASYGVLMGVSSIGGLAANVAVARLADSPKVPLLLSASALGFGLALIATGFAPTFAVALVTMAFVGAASSAFQVLNSAAAFREADPAYLGRVSSLMNIAWSLTNLAGLPIGLLADSAGERATLVGIGVALCGLAPFLSAWSAPPARRAAAATVEAPGGS